MTYFMKGLSYTPNPSFLESFEFDGAVGKLNVIRAWLIKRVPQLDAPRIDHLRVLVIHSIGDRNDVNAYIDNNAFLRILQACQPLRPSETLLVVPGICVRVVVVCDDL